MNFQSLLDNYPVLLNSYFGNSVWKYLMAVILLLIFLIVFRLIQRSLLHHLEKLSKKTQTDIDDTLIEIVNTLRPPFYTFLAFYLAVNYLQFNAYIKQGLDAVLITWVVYQVVHALEILIKYIARKHLAKEDAEGSTQSAVQALNIISRILLWSIAILLVLSNLGFDVTSLAASLGIGGIAVAFAVQGILSDLFSSFTIFFDKPFKVGDFVTFGQQAGTVEKIGIKTTRVRSLQGEEIVVPNQSLTNETIQNYKKMQNRRIEFQFGVTYDTTHKKLAAIPSWIETIISQEDHAEFSRAHFHSFGDSALTFVVVYKVTESDYGVYMDTQQAINLAIVKKFEQEQVEMAFPTRTVYLKKEA